MSVGDYTDKLNKNMGWICPKCGRVNAPWARFCDCADEQIYDPSHIYTQPIEPTFKTSYECCKNCQNNPVVNPNASGICNCSLPALEVSLPTTIPGTKSNTVYTFYWEDGELITKQL